MSEHAYGWKRDSPDPRDLLFLATQTPVMVDVDLRPKMPLVFDQLALGACTSNASTAVTEYAEHREGDRDWGRLSRLEVYYRSRELEGSTSEDAGAEIRDSFKVIAQRGAARESLWPYDISKYADTPPASLSRSDRYHRAIEYRAVAASPIDMMSCLSQGFPFAFGFDVYESFENLGPDALYNPGVGEQLLGGHAVVCVGYKTSDKTWIVRNSWGTGWGDHGHFYVPLVWMARNAEDAWTVTKVT
jgi:C1A family cysteine protease